ncbi:hypothetical protein B0H14DRAFT_3535337 [Mycena olivaceomarginata]|nr:hypothetical protein B0H14DRAFT_3535337 [Mycena olivaceomarginata]
MALLRFHICRQFAPAIIGALRVQIRHLHFSPRSILPRWLVHNEVRVVIKSKLFPGTAPPAVARPPMPHSEINRLAHKTGRENILQRTLRPIPASVVGVPGTPDQRILHACQRKSYPAPSISSSTM